MSARTATTSRWNAALLLLFIAGVVSAAAYGMFYVSEETKHTATTGSTAPPTTTDDDTKEPPPINTSDSSFGTGSTVYSMELITTEVPKVACASVSDKTMSNLVSAPPFRYTAATDGLERVVTVALDLPTPCNGDVLSYSLGGSGWTSPMKAITREADPASAGAPMPVKTITVYGNTVLVCRTMNGAPRIIAYSPDDSGSAYLARGSSLFSLAGMSDITFGKSLFILSGSAAQGRMVVGVASSDRQSSSHQPQRGVVGLYAMESGQWSSTNIFVGGSVSSFADHLALDRSLGNFGILACYEPLRVVLCDAGNLRPVGFVTTPNEHTFHALDMRSSLLVVCSSHNRTRERQLRAYRITYDPARSDTASAKQLLVVNEPQMSEPPLTGTLRPFGWKLRVSNDGGCAVLWGEVVVMYRLRDGRLWAKNPQFLRHDGSANPAEAVREVHLADDGQRIVVVHENTMMVYRNRRWT